METLQTLVRSLAWYGRRPAIVALQKHGVETWRFADLADHVQRLATGLSEAGLSHGTRGVLFAPNRSEWIIACFALIEAGAIPVPVDAQVGDEDLRHILKDSEARWIFTTATRAERVARAHPDKDFTLVLLDAGGGDARTWRRYLAGQGREFQSVKPEDPAVLFYTSGTTGPPKGVPLTHRNLTSNLQALLDEKLLSFEDRLLLPLPLHHVYPFTVGMLTPLVSGVPIVFPLSLLGPQILRALQEEEITIIVAVPRFYSALYAAIEMRLRPRGRIAQTMFRSALNLSIALRRRFGLRIGRWLFAPLHRRFAPRLRRVVSGGAALDPDLAWKLEGLGWEVASGYGLTETSPILTFNLPGRGRLDGAGRPLPGVEIRIAEPGRQAAYGEVLARGPNVCSGYRNLPKKTKEVFTDDGYFRTGDLGYLKDGYLYLVGRASSMIVLPGGENIQPEQVEEVLERGQHIREAGVLQKDHRLVALLVPEPAATRDDRERDLERLIRRDVQQQSRSLPSHHRITDYAIVFDPLTRTPLGKIRRHKLKDAYERAKRHAGKGKQTGPIPIEHMAPEDRQLLEDRAARQVWEWLPQRFPDARLTPDANLQLDLGVDSLEWLNLTLELRERIGIDLSSDAIGRIETVRDLMREAAEAGEAAGAGGDPLEQLQRPLELLDERQQRWLKPQGPVMRIVGAALLGLARLLVKGLFRLNVRGLDHLPQQGPFVLTPNHTSFLDPLALASALPKSVLRRTYWGGWMGIMFTNPIMRLVSRATRIVPVDQGRGALPSLAFGVAILDRGDILVWYPEGGRSPSGKLQAFQPGIGFLLHVRRVPVVPVWIAGGHEALPLGAWWPRFRPITVVYGKPVDPEELQRHGQGDEPHHRITAALHDQVARLRMNAE